MALVIADEQFMGKGRHGRKWNSVPGASLTFSLVLRKIEDIFCNTPDGIDRQGMITRMTALGALAVSQGLLEKLNITSEIKWPNDVLLNRRKVAGILAEIHWQSSIPLAGILGIGINVKRDSAPANDELIWPATSVEEIHDYPINRLELLRAIIEQVLEWRKHLAQPGFINAWEERLAFKGEWVNIIIESDTQNQDARTGLVLGLDEVGGLRLLDRVGQEFTLQMGEIRLLPIEKKSNIIYSGEPDNAG